METAFSHPRLIERSKDFGRVVRLTEDLAVTLGEITTVELHPSGVRFDGPAVVVAAFRSNGRNVIRVVSLADPTAREVTRVIA